MIALTILWGCVVALLVLVMAMVPQRSRRTVYQRTQEAGKKIASLDSRREASLVAMLSLQRAVGAVLLLTSAYIAVATWGWGVGLIVSFVVAVFYGRIASLKTVVRMAARLYQRYEGPLLVFAARYGTAVKMPVVHLEPVVTISSRDELIHTLGTLSKSVITVDERAALLHGLQFHTQQVASLVIPLSDMQTIEESELLGPLVLDGLHKTGQRRFVVCNADGAVSGILDIGAMLHVRSGVTQTAAEAMQQSMFFIHQDESLEQALGLCLGAHDSLLLVVDDAAKVVGVILLDDIVSTLTGRELRQSPDHYDSSAAALRSYKTRPQ